MALGKRQKELLNSRSKKTETRKVLNKYNLPFLEKTMYMCLTLVIICYSLWATDANVINTYTNDYLIWTVPYFSFLIIYYNYLIDGESSGDPVEVLFSNKSLFALAIGYAGLMFLIMYLI